MSFNKKGMVLALAGILALGGVGGAAAFIIKDATKVHQDFTGDEAIKIKWGQTTSQDLNVTGLTPTSFVYKQVEVEVGKSTNSEITQGHIDFSLNETTADGKKYIKVEIAKTEFVEGTVVDATLHDVTKEKGYTFELDGSNPIFYLKFSLTESAKTLGDIGETVKPAGQLTISLGEGATLLA